MTEEQQQQQVERCPVQLRDSNCLCQKDILNLSVCLQQEKQQEAEERRQTMLNQVLQPSARERRKVPDPIGLHTLEYMSRTMLHILIIKHHMHCSECTF